MRLRVWRETDRDAFAALNDDPEVTHDLGGPLTRGESNRKFERYARAFERHGYGRWLVETTSGQFLGYCGIMPVRGEHPLGDHHEIGWRLARNAWGCGYATEAARAALVDVFESARLTEVLAGQPPLSGRHGTAGTRAGSFARFHGPR